MIKSKKINIIIAIAVVFALIVSVALIIMGSTKAQNSDNYIENEYATKIFGSSIISLDIIADEDDWQYMLDNAINEEYIMVDIIVNGTKFQNVGIRPKGNSSLTHIVNSDSDRYSFRLKFDEYIKGQTCFGLDSFVVNNMFTDYTYMKEYISYELMKEVGVDVPYFGYADIKVNGESWGLYLAIENYNESYEQRVFGDVSGMLYNVKRSENIDNQMEIPSGGQNNRNQMPGEVERFPQLPGQQQDFPNNIGLQDGGILGGSLEYIDDNVESYSDIFDNVVGKGTESDYQRVIEALKALSEGTDLEKYFNVDKILRYLAAHTIVVNLDSYSSNMAQNYYIYERDGKITILPWDYNQSWGGFQGTDAVSVINFPIDTPVNGVEMSSRPLIEKLFANDEYLERYHSYMQMLIDNYFADGKFTNKINSLDALISEYVKNDSTAFCTYEEYKVAVESFITLGNLRAQSVQGQLDGTIPSTTLEQKLNSSKLISSGSLNLNALGSAVNVQDGINRRPQENILPNFPVDNNQQESKLTISNSSYLFGLSVVLIIAIIFVAKFKKEY